MKIAQSQSWLRLHNGSQRPLEILQYPTDRTSAFGQRLIYARLCSGFSFHEIALPAIMPPQTATKPKTTLVAT